MYADKLKDPRWQQRRLRILERDYWTCRQCGEASKHLHVHHRYYVPGKEPWEAPDEALMTLCEDCHKGVHNMTIMHFRKGDGHTGGVRVREDGYVNADDIAETAPRKPGRQKKRYGDYAENQQSKEFAEALSNLTGIPVKFLTDSKTGPSGGKWLHPKIAIHFASWCSAESAVLVTDIIERYLKGDVSLATEIIDRQTDQQVLDWTIERTEAKKSNLIRNKEIETRNGDGWIYAHCSDNLNVQITSFKAKDIKQMTGVEKTRDAMDPLHLALIRAGELAQVAEMKRQNAKGNDHIKKCTDKSDAVIGRAARELKMHDPRLLYDHTNQKLRQLKEPDELDVA